MYKRFNFFICQTVKGTHDEQYLNNDLLEKVAQKAINKGMLLLRNLNMKRISV